MVRLHGFSQFGNTFKVAFPLGALSQPWEPVFVDFLHGATRGAPGRPKFESAARSAELA